jgi:cytochrome c oxidase subunit 2
MLAGLAATLASTAVWASDLVGQPTDRAIDLQPAASVLKHDAIFFHNQILLPIITAITVFVFVLLLIIVVRFNKKANPVAAKWSHNTLLEVIWTVIPVGILVVIAAYSFPLLYKYDNMPKPDLTIKAVGHQWYWSYEYPDHEGVAFDSYLVEEKDLKPGQPRLLAVDNPIVVPVNKVVEVIVTAEDVIHNFAMPAFGLKTDAVPGRLNHTWFKAEKVGNYYGQCSELCGVRHAFMPIQIKVVSDADYAAWLAKNGAAPAAAPVADAAAPVAAPAASDAPVAAPAAH